jgi:hypothetical protein
LKYKHEEKLALAVVLAVQKLRHYILLRTTKVVADSNPMQYFLSHRQFNENSLDGSLSFRSTTSSSQHLRVRRPSFSLNLSQPSPLTPPVPPSIPTFPTNISFISLRMILGTTTSSSTSELKSLVTTFHDMIDDAFTIRPPAISSLETSYTGGALTPFFIVA